MLSLNRLYSFSFVYARLLLCGFYLLNFLGLSPHFCRAGYTCFKLQNSVVPPTIAICLLANFPESRTSRCLRILHPLRLPRRWSRLLPDAQSWGHLHSAGCWVAVQYKVLPPKLWCIYCSSCST